MDRLARMDRKLNYLVSSVLAVLGLALGTVVYFCLRELVGDHYAFIAGVMVAWALPLFMEIWFRRADV